MYHEMVVRDVVLQLTRCFLKPTTCKAEAFKLSLARTSLTRKASPELSAQLGLPSLSADELANASIKSFLDQENVNKETNHRLLHATSGCMASILHRASRIALSILGEFEFSSVIDHCGFGPGTMVGVTGDRLDLPRKFAEDISYTPECSRLIPVLLEEIPSWQAKTRLVMGGEYFTVPKDAKTDRGCEKQPSGNLFLQKGVGAMMRKRLRKHGINLSDQSINQRRAREGSVTNDLATWDGRNASNSLCREMVREVLWYCPDWYWFMDSVRTHRVKLPDGTWHELEMFSAMGNGFTFELESLLFYCLAKATADHYDLKGLVTVYGDDMIFPTSWYSLVVETFTHMGIQTNEDKSFITGPFRESCGGDYYLGQRVTPLYLKKPIKGLADMIRLANRIREVAIKWGDGLYADNTWKPAWDAVCTYVLQQGGRYGPLNCEGVIHTDSKPDDLSYNSLGYLRVPRVLVTRSRRYTTELAGRKTAGLSKLGHFGSLTDHSVRLATHRLVLRQFAVASRDKLADLTPYKVKEADFAHSSYDKFKRVTVINPVWSVPFLE